MENFNVGDRVDLGDRFNWEHNIYLDEIDLEDHDTPYRSGDYWYSEIRAPQPETTQPAIKGPKYKAYDSLDASWIGRVVMDKGENPDAFVITSIGLNNEGFFVVCVESVSCINVYSMYTLEECFNHLLWCNGVPFGKLV